LIWLNAARLQRPDSRARRQSTPVSSVPGHARLAGEASDRLQGAAAMIEISPEKVCFIIIKAREFDAKVEIEEPDPGSNPSDEEMRAVLQDYADDATYQELKEAIDGMNEEEQINLVALLWLGRGDYTKDDWSDALKEARDAHNKHTAEYLTGTPMLGDLLEEGLAELGISCADYELGRL
jgi:hypothetical protein